MKNNEQVSIKEISIKNFRSISTINIRTDRINMLVGLNDVGKSNVLKALNLFFNGETDYNEKFLFGSDFSKLYSPKSKKAKEITIMVTFDVPSKYKGYGEYIWEKRWRKDGIVKDEIRTSTGEDISPRSRIPNLLRKIVYRYVPAVKSKEYYRVLLIELYKAVSSAVDSPLITAAEQFSLTLQEHTSALSEQILSYIGMKSELALPQNFSEIFETLMFQTQKTDSDIMVPLSQRGDGIQARHIPIILSYIATEDYKQSNSQGSTKINTVWGFEEPENGLELIKAFEMADEFLEYSKEVQIFVTTHSPAFYAKKDEEGVKVIYIQKSIDNDATILLSNPQRSYMDENLGLMPLVTPYIAETNKRIYEMKRLWEETPLLDKPTIMVEGKSDRMYLEMAIRQLSKTLSTMIDNDNLRIVTREDGAGTTLIKNWVIAWLHSGNTSKMMAVFDKDDAGEKATSELKKYDLYTHQNQNINVKVIQLEPSDEIITCYRAGLQLPFEIEHLLSVEIWQRAIMKKYVSPRSSNELLEAYKNELPRNKTIDSILDEGISEQNIRETIANYNPHEDKKMQFCNMVERICRDNEAEGVFSGFTKTILKMEQFFL